MLLSLSVLGSWDKRDLGTRYFPCMSHKEPCRGGVSIIIRSGVITLQECFSQRKLQKVALCRPLLSCMQRKCVNNSTIISQHQFVYLKNSERHNILSSLRFSYPERNDQEHRKHLTISKTKVNNVVAFHGCSNKGSLTKGPFLS